MLSPENPPMSSRISNEQEILLWIYNNTGRTECTGLLQTALQRRTRRRILLRVGSYHVQRNLLQSDIPCSCVPWHASLCKCAWGMTIPLKIEAKRLRLSSNAQFLAVQRSKIWPNRPTASYSSCRRHQVRHTTSVGATACRSSIAKRRPNHSHFSRKNTF